ncbi:MAG: LON peptidase substrate-binding domain-containing protein, partial [Myxococcota bacterium]
MAEQDDNQSVPDPRSAPLLPLRDIIVFPNMVVPLFVGREKSINALKQAMGRDKAIVLCAQKKAKTNEPTPDDIFEVGTLGTIRQLIQLPDGTVKVLVMGERRVHIERFVPNERYFQVEVVLLAEGAKAGGELEELIKRIRSTFETYVKLNRRIPPEMLGQIAKIDDPSRLADTIVAQLALKLADKQRILETQDAGERLHRLFDLMQEEIEILQVEKKIRKRVKKQMEKTQKDYYINDVHQLPKNEPSDGNEFKNEIEELEARIRDKEMSEEAHERLQRELRKLKMMSPMSAEATVVRNYIDWVLSLPWTERTDDPLDLHDAKRVLDRDHF